MAVSEHSLAFTERRSLLNRTYPLVKLIWVFAVALGLFFFRTPFPGAVLFIAMLALAIIAGRIPVAQILASSRVIFLLGLLLLVFHLFTDPGIPIYHLGPLTISSVGIVQGPIIFFRLSVVVLASFLLIWTTDTRDLMVSLAKAGMPYRLAFAVFLALRFLPLIQREVDAVHDAHSIRGQAAHSGIRHRILLWQRYIFTVLINGLRKAETTATSLECRGFGSHPTRTYLKDVTFRPVDLLLPILSLLLIAALIFLERTALPF